MLPITKQRFDKHDQDELHLIGSLLGHEVFSRTFIVLTYADELDPKHSSRVIETYKKDLPAIIEQECYLDFDKSKILVSDFNNFEPFLESLGNHLGQTPKFRPKLASGLNPSDPESIKQFLLSSQIKEVMKAYEMKLQEERNRLDRMKSQYNAQANENARINQRLAQVEQQRAWLDQQLEDLKRMKSERESYLSREISRWEEISEQSNLINEISRLKSERSEKDSLINSLSQKISQLEAKVESQKSHDPIEPLFIPGGFPGVRVVRLPFGSFY